MKGGREEGRKENGCMEERVKEREGKSEYGKVEEREAG